MPSPTPRRRWYQFSLRRLFLATACVAAACGIAALDSNQIGLDEKRWKMLYVFYAKPILIGSLCGWSLGIIFERQLIGYTIGLTLSVVGIGYWLATN